MKECRFKKGDRVRLRSRVKKFRFGKGTVSFADTGIVLEVSPRTDPELFNVFVRFPQHDKWHGIDNEITLVTKGEDMKEESTEWSFHSTSGLDINYQEILEAMSHKNPLALITRGDKYTVAVRRSLIKKAEVCLLPLPNTSWVHRTELGQVMTCKQTDFAEWIAWAKVVKHAKWPKEYRYPATVTVITPTI